MFYTSSNQYFSIIILISTRKVTLWIIYLVFIEFISVLISLSILYKFEEKKKIYQQLIQEMTLYINFFKYVNIYMPMQCYWIITFDLRTTFERICAHTLPIHCCAYVN